MSDVKTILIIDDEPDIRELLEITLTRMGMTTRTAEDVQGAILALRENQPDLCLTDMKLPDGDGLEIVEYIQKHHSGLPVAVISAHGTMEIAIQALKLGAFDFVSKPLDLKQLRSLVSSALNLKTYTDTKASPSVPGLIGVSESFRTMIGKAYKLSRSQAPVFICGESGTGKELVARYIHQQGPRKDGPFIAVNCGAIPAELMESEFFGHVKGSFTGATTDKQGFFQAAQQGTLFLDEVADLPVPMQVKLLRAIQEKKIRHVGHHQEVAIDVRILSATHKNLNHAVDQGLFRQDLFYRLNVIQLDIPPLRNRQADIDPLISHCLLRLANDYGSEPIELSTMARQRLHRYSYPGNVRELENILERAFALCDGHIINDYDLGLDDVSALFPDAHHESQTTAGRTREPGSLAVPTTGEVDLKLPEGQNLEDYMANIERALIKQALQETRWNKTAAAKNLGISFRALRYKLKKLDLE